VGVLYDAYLKGKSSPLPDLSIQYADFAHWQRQWLTGEVLDKQLNYWRSHLAGAPALLELPTDFPRPAVQSYKGARYSFSLSEEVTDGLRQLCQKHDTTLYVVLLAAFNVLLSRYSGQTDISVGTVIANRNHSEIENLIGFFVNTLVMRNDLSANPRFEDFIKQARDVAMGAYAHQDLPFEHLVEVLNPARNMSHSPLFQASLVLQNAPKSTLELSGLKLKPTGSGNSTTLFDLALFINEADSQLAADFEYRTDLFKRDTIVRMSEHLRVLLETAVRDPGRRLAELPLLSAGEFQQVVYDWNATSQDYPATCAHVLFEQQVEKNPHAVAVRFDDQSITYAELNTRANQLAHHLRAAGVKPESRVGIYLDRHLNMVIAVLAVLKAGGAYVPLDTDWPAARVEQIVAVHALSIILTDGAHDEAAAKMQVACSGLSRVIRVDQPLRQHMPTDNPEALSHPDNCAYIIFTSGSTGQPKGVVVRHRAVANLIHWVNRTFDVTPADQLLFVTSLCFDLSVYDIFGTLAAGATIRVATRAEIREPERLLSILLEEPITFWNSAPAAFQQLAPLLASVPRDCEYALRRVFFSGDWIAVSLPDAIREAFKDAKVISLGGATEATVWSNSYAIAMIDPNWASIPYGKPMQNAQYHVLDSRLAPCPAGVPGDLYIAGDCLADGYAGDAVLTAGKFIPNPFSKMPGMRMYFTGDRARYGADGNIEFLGRIDQQVKIRGFRIE
ncbi:MAG TPA: amino acid adenylation domain-containing protein, partial [Rhodocyclaceae bacterium]|nr:amino acid adenylation domain-containing protein [Rhodocyclaceae bacterium]